MQRVVEYCPDLLADGPESVVLYLIKVEDPNEILASFSLHKRLCG